MCTDVWTADNDEREVGEERALVKEWITIGEAHEHIDLDQENDLIEHFKSLHLNLFEWLEVDQIYEYHHRAYDEVEKFL